MILTILGNLCALGGLVCAILVLIKHFQNKETVHAIIGICTCTLWTFIWGWATQAKYGLKKIMLIWTACFVVSIVVTGIRIPAAIAEAKAMTEELTEQSLEAVPELPVAE